MILDRPNPSILSVATKSPLKPLIFKFSPFGVDSSSSSMPIPMSSPTPPPELRKTFKTLKSYTSKLATFTLQWQDLEDHFLFIKTQLQQLETAHNSNARPSREYRGNAKKTSLDTGNEHPNDQFGRNNGRLSVSDLIPVESGKSLFLYLHNRVKEIEVLKEDVYNALTAVSDPGKLVLEALSFFYLDKRDMGLDVGVTRKVCVVLLEQLIKAGPLAVGHQDTVEAMRIALEWKEKMAKTVNSIEILGFLMLVAAFGLVSEFPKDEIMELVEKVVQREQVPELFRAFGYANEADDFIQKLIKQNKRLEAVRFIYTFELADRFPPVPLLKEHSKYIEEISSGICDERNNSSKALDTAIGALRGVIKLINKYKLQSDYSPKILRSRIQQLKRRRSRSKVNETATLSVANPLLQIGNKQAAPEAQPDNHAMHKHVQTGAPADVVSDVSLSTAVTINSKHQSHCQETGLYLSESVNCVSPSAGKVATGATISVTVTSTRPSVDSSELLPASLSSGEGAQKLSLSWGYDFTQPPAKTVHGSSPSAASAIYSMHSSHLYSASLSTLREARQCSESSRFNFLSTANALHGSSVSATAEYTSLLHPPSSFLSGQGARQMDLSSGYNTGIPATTFGGSSLFGANATASSSHLFQSLGSVKEPYAHGAPASANHQEF